jgi:hypothetical protein
LPQLTFYPLGCANTALVELKDGRRVLVDYANRWTGAGDDKRCDLPKLLKADLDAAGAKDYAVVAFTHLDWSTRRFTKERAATRSRPCGFRRLPSPRRA